MNTLNAILLSPYCDLFSTRRLNELNLLVVSMFRILIDLWKFQPMNQLFELPFWRIVLINIAFTKINRFCGRVNMVDASVCENTVTVFDNTFRNQSVSKALYLFGFLKFSSKYIKYMHIDNVWLENSGTWLPLPDGCRHLSTLMM